LQNAIELGLDRKNPIASGHPGLARCPSTGSSPRPGLPQDLIPKAYDLGMEGPKASEKGTSLG
jgi:hypothetical protein